MESETGQELRAIFQARGPASARHCLALARAAQEAGDCAEIRKWTWRAWRRQTLRMTAARWGQRAQWIAPTLLCLALLLHGCGKAPAHDEPFRAYFTRWRAGVSRHIGPGFHDSVSR